MGAVPMKIPVFTSRKAALVPEMGLVPPIHTKFTYYLSTIAASVHSDP